MGETPIIDLGRVGSAVRWREKKPAPLARMAWSMILLLAAKDRASEVRFAPHHGEHSLTYLIDGVEHELVPPPEWVGAVMVDELKSMTRNRGVRAWLARLLRGAASRLDRSLPDGCPCLLRADGLYLGASITIRPADVAKEVILRFDPDENVSLRAWEIMRRCYGQGIGDSPGKDAAPGPEADRSERNPDA